MGTTLLGDSDNFAPAFFHEGLLSPAQRPNCSASRRGVAGPFLPKLVEPDRDEGAVRLNRL